MALLHRAQITPTKVELLKAWVPSQPWSSQVDVSSLELAGAYRFDDPDGAVGVETHLLPAPGGQVLQVPLTYRDAPLAGAEPWLITTMEHSVLGKRWVYDGGADPVYARALATAILTGGTQADLDVLTDDGVQRRPPTTLVRGTGSAGSPVPGSGPVSYANETTKAVLSWGGLSLTVLRFAGTGGLAEAGGLPAGAQTLVGTWPGRDEPALLAFLGKAG